MILFHILMYLDPSKLWNMCKCKTWNFADLAVQLFITAASCAGHDCWYPRLAVLNLTRGWYTVTQWYTSVWGTLLYIHTEKDGTSFKIFYNMHNTNSWLLVWGKGACIPAQSCHAPSMRQVRRHLQESTEPREHSITRSSNSEIAPNQSCSVCCQT